MKIFKQSFRNLTKNGNYQLINIFGLTVALAAFLLIIVFVLNEFQFDKFVDKRERIFRVEEGANDQVPLAISRLSKEQFPEIENSVVVKSLNNSWVSYENDFYSIDNFCFAENSFFDIFSIPFMLGDQKTALIEPYSLVLTESVAKLIFNDTNPIGQKVNFKNEDDYTITGVIKDVPDFHLPAKAVASFSSIEKKYLISIDNWGWNFVSYVVLPEQHNVKSVEAKMNDFFESRNGWDIDKVDFKLRSFKNIYLDPEVQANDETKHGNIKLLIILIIVGIFILLIASINYINLSISNGLKKTVQIFVRKVLGSTKGKILYQFVIDSVVICLISLIMASLIVFACIQAYGNLVGREFYLLNVFTYKHILLLIVGTIVWGILCGIFPALYLTNNNIVNASAAKKKLKFNTGLITVQYAVSIILICGTLLITKQLKYMRNTDYGLNKEMVLSVELTDYHKSKLDILKQKLFDNPDISAVSFTSDKITRLHEYGMVAEIDGEKQFFNYAIIDPDFTKLLDVKIKEGENFSWEVPSQISSSYLINEAGWNLIKNSELKTKDYVLDGMSFLGVVNDFNFESFHNQVKPMIFTWGLPDYYNNALIKFTNINYAQAVNFVKETFKEIDPKSYFQYSFLDETFDQMYKSEQLLALLLMIFSILAIIIASLGIFSLSSISAENRNKEIGIRKVNGAKVIELIQMLNKEFIKWVMAAFAIAIPIAYYAMNKWLESFVYKTTLSWWIFALAGLSALVIAVISVSWQTYRAARRNPVEALRYE